MADNEAGGLIDRKKYNYQATKIKTKDGKVRKSYGNGDAVAKAMLGLDSDQLVTVIKKNKLDDKLGKHIGNVNAGQMRMFVGNALRALVRKGNTVTIGKHQVASLDQDIDISALEASNDDKPAPKAEPKKSRKKAA